MQKKLKNFLQRAEAFLDKIEALIPQPISEDWQAPAYRWSKTYQQGSLKPIYQPHIITLEDLHYIEIQKEKFINNIEQFLYHLPYNHILLTGARGTGKSSLVKALLTKYQTVGLKIIEVDKDYLHDLPDIISHLYQRPERFIIFSDDVSFNAQESSYKAIKAMLDGSLQNLPDNVLLCITSNRRHLLPEYFKDNQEINHVDGEIHPNEAIEEQISLSERFGLWLHFYPFKQQEYLAIVEYWLKKQNIVMDETIEKKAIQYALQRGSRSGRIAGQFARYYAGEQLLLKK